MLIFENSIIEFLDLELKTELIIRVLWISPDEEDVFIININDHKKVKFPYVRKYNELLTDIKDGRAKFMEADPDLRLISPEEDYLTKYKKYRDANWNIIKDIVDKEPEIYFPNSRGPIISQAVEDTGKSKKEIYRLLKRYWFYGKTKNALLRNYFDCGASGEPREYKKKTGPKSKDKNSYIILDKDKEIFKKAIKQFHVDKKMDLTATHQHMCEEWFHKGFYRQHGAKVPIVEAEKSPTLRQFRYWYNNEYSHSQKYSNRKGKRKTNMDIRPLLGDTTERALGIGYLYEIDSTPADIILVAEDRKTIIGTPTLYIVKDVYSRMITGFHASLSPASKIELMVAMVNSASNKVEFCKQYGIEIEESDWPCENLPKYLAGDRGDIKGKWSENLVNLKVDVDNAPSYRGDLKPFVEQHFRITNKEIRELLSKAGAKPPRLIDRGDENPARNAALTIDEFTQFMIIQIITFNKSALPKEYFVTREMFEERVELTPLGVWNWDGRRRLLHQEPRDLLIYNLLPKGRAIVTRWGIKINEMCYTSDIGLRDEWFIEERIEGQKEIKASYDPRNVSSIFIRLKNGKIEQCFLTGKYKEYEGLHLEDVNAIFKYKKEEINTKEREEKQHKAVLHAYTKNLVKGALEKTKEATKDISFYQREKNKRETKKIDSRTKGSQKALTMVESKDNHDEKSTKDTVLIFPKENQITTIDDGNKVQQLFGAKNKERRRGHESLE